LRRSSSRRFDVRCELRGQSPVSLIREGDTEHQHHQNATARLEGGPYVTTGIAGDLFKPGNLKIPQHAGAVKLETITSGNDDVRPYVTPPGGCGAFAAEGTTLFQALGNLVAGTPAATPCIYIGQAPSTPLSHREKKDIERQAHEHNVRHRKPGQHQGPLTAATLRVLHVLLWTFHNTEHGYCWPSLRKIAAAARCCRDTAHEAVKALRAAGLLRWWHQFKRKTIGRLAALFRTSNAYQFRQVPTLPVAVATEQQRTENPHARTGTGEEKQSASQVICAAASRPSRHAPSAAEAAALEAAIARGRLRAGLTGQSDGRE
jgi:hypothetical protein